ncbi:MAG: class I SAM-dependent methyltransferase [Firmicutes bacterium]|nr:class I SAM-dependent methyltransferase [Bacillota bacterium]
MEHKGIDPGSEKTRLRYDRLAPLYDWLEGPMEAAAMDLWRRHLWRRVSQWLQTLPGGAASTPLLEAGVGTGRNFPHHPAGAHIVGVDFSPEMLARARARAHLSRSELRLELMDVEDLRHPADFFAGAVATFVFCSVAHPRRGLEELRRVVRRGGRLFLLEHIRPPGRMAGRIADLLNPLARSLIGDNINRRTLDTVEQSGWRIIERTPLWHSIVYFVEAE